MADTTITSTQCPCAIVKDFTYINNFAILMELLPSVFNLTNDTPILYNEVDPLVLQSPDNIVVDGNYITQDPNVDNLMSLVDQYTGPINDNIQNIIDDIQNAIKNPSGDVECPEPPAPSDDSTDTTNNDPLNINEPYTPTPVSDGVIVFCPDNDTSSYVPEIDVPTSIDPFNTDVEDSVDIICHQTDDKLKSFMNFSLNELNDGLDEINNQVNPEDTKNQMLDAFRNLTGYDITNINDYDDYVNDLKNAYEDSQAVTLLQTEEVYLGIPLITLDKDKKIIVQLRDRKLEVINLRSYDNQKLFIDQEIPLNKKFTIIFSTNGYVHSLYLIYDDDNGDRVVLQDEINVPVELTLSYIGIDPLAKKNYCGYILNIEIFKYYKNILDVVDESNNYFEFPAGALYFYDWYKDRIVGNRVYPLPNLERPVKMYGNSGFYHLNTDKPSYYFMEKGYLSEFFCSMCIFNYDWTMNFWIYIPDYLTTVNPSFITDERTIVHDFKNQNNLKYDTKLNCFVFEFGGKYEKIPYILNKNTWYNIILKYNNKSTDLSNPFPPSMELIIRNTETEYVDKYSYDYEENFPFDLHSMLVEFNGRNYEKFFNCRFGTLALFAKKTDEVQDDYIFNQQKTVIKTLNL